VSEKSSSPSSAAPEASGRLSTGVPALDTMLMGGLLPGRPYLIVGPSGTGKTTLALQFLLEGIRRGEPCLMLTLEEPPNEIRLNHRELQPILERVFVFDAIPDVMRYERAPFKDIAAVRESVMFESVPLEIRKTAELTSVEVTLTALEQTLKSELARRNYKRLVVDSLTALQYFCMKGLDEVLGAQTFLRFLSDLHLTTVLTVESPLEDVESPERLLARGEIRMFRWELEGVTVRAIGVEKLRGSQHDIRLHPYRISPRGIDINLGVTISRDTRRVLPADELGLGAVAPGSPEAETGLDALEQDATDLAAIGVSPASVLAAIEAALKEARSERLETALTEIGRARALVLTLFQEYREGPGAHDVTAAARRLNERSATVRAGVPPMVAPESTLLVPALETLSARLERAAERESARLSEPPAPPAAKVMSPGAGTPLAGPAPPPPPPPIASDAAPPGRSPSTGASAIEQPPSPPTPSPPVTPAPALVPVERPAASSPPPSPGGTPAASTPKPATRPGTVRGLSTTERPSGARGRSADREPPSPPSPSSARSGSRPPSGEPTALLAPPGPPKVSPDRSPPPLPTRLPREEGPTAVAPSPRAEPPPTVPETRQPPMPTTVAPPSPAPSAPSPVAIEPPAPVPTVMEPAPEAPPATPAPAAAPARAPRKPRSPSATTRRRKPKAAPGAVSDLKPAPEPASVPSAVSAPAPVAAEGPAPAESLASAPSPLLAAPAIAPTVAPAAPAIAPTAEAKPKKRRAPTRRKAPTVTAVLAVSPPPSDAAPSAGTPADAPPGGAAGEAGGSTAAPDGSSRSPTEGASAPPTPSGDDSP